MTVRIHFGARHLRQQVLSLVDEGVEVVTRIGPWTRRRVVPRAEVLAVLTRATDDALYVRTPTGVVTLVDAGTPSERQAAKLELSAALDLGHVVRTTLPPGFVESEGDGNIHIVKRRLLGRIAWGLVGITGFAAGSWVSMAWVMALALVVLAGAVAREEWSVTGRFISHRWHLGPFQWLRAERLTNLRLERERDADDNLWFRLVAPTPKGRHVLLSELRDAEEPAALGEHLAKLAGARLDYGEGCEALAPPA